MSDFLWYQQRRQQSGPTGPWKPIFGCLLGLSLMIYVIIRSKRGTPEIDGATELSEFFPEGLPTSESQEQALDWLSEDRTSYEYLIVGTDSDKRSLLERFVLAVIYYATGGDEWYYEEEGIFGPVQWLSKKRVCLWAKVVCLDEQKVTYINLEGSSAIGSIPTEFALLTSLDGLSLGYNSMTGTIPTQLAELQKLTSLFLSYNHFNGTIPTELALLTNLVHLEIDENSLTGSIPTEFGRLTNLESLILAYNNFTGTIPTELGLLKKITWLNLGNNNLTGTVPTELGALPDLKWIDAEHNNLSGTVPTEFADFIAKWTGFACHLGGNPNLSKIPETCNITTAGF